MAKLVDHDSGSGMPPADSSRLSALEAENARLTETVRDLHRQMSCGAATQDANEPGEAGHFRTLADNIPQLAWIADRTGWIFWYNKRWYDYTGTNPEEMQGWGWKAVHHPDHVDRVVGLFAAAIASGEPWEDTFPLRGADGTFRWFLSRALPIRDAAGDVVRWFGTNTDITEQLAHEVALREVEERRRLATEGAGIGLWEYRPATGELRWDSRCKALFGIPPETEMTFSLFLDRLHPDDREWVREAVLRATGGEDGAGEPEAYAVEYRIIEGQTGQERWIAASGQAFDDGAGGVRFAGTVLDITERKQAEYTQQLLINELNHRVKNTLATVQAIATRTLRSASTIDEAREALLARLVTLARAHDILTAESWEGAEMAEVARAALAAHGDSLAGRLDMSGPYVRISPKKALALFMALHELATNASKYGALSNDSGRVSVCWEARGGGENRRLVIEWRETGGPPVTPPPRSGFGARLLRQGLTGQLGASVELDYRTEGVRCVIDAPLLHVDRKTPR